MRISIFFPYHPSGGALYDNGRLSSYLWLAALTGCYRQMYGQHTQHHKNRRKLLPELQFPYLLFNLPIVKGFSPGKAFLV
jgi:hypothetical protein